MRIAYLTTTLDETNGWGRYAAGFLAEARERNGVENVILPNPAGFRSNEIRWHQPFYALIDAWTLRDELKSAEVIHAAIEPAAPVAFFLSILLGKPYVVSVCGTFADLRSYSWPVRWLYRLAFRHAGRMAVLSRYTLKIFEMGMKDARTIIVYGGFTPTLSTVRKETKQSGRRILAVGAIKRRKGFHTLVEALGQLKTKGFEFNAEFIGPLDTSNYAESIKARVTELGLEDCVRLAGRVSEDELNAAYDSADLFVLPSEHDGTAFEGLGLVYLEALARGLPVIGCLESGAEDIVRDGLNGFLVPPGDASKLAAAIEMVMGNDELRNKMSLVAPGSIERFRWEKVGADMDSAYRAAIAEYAS